MSPRSDPEVMALTTAIHVLVEQARALTSEIEQVVDDLSAYDVVTEEPQVAKNQTGVRDERQRGIIATFPGSDSDPDD